MESTIFHNAFRRMLETVPELSELPTTKFWIEIDTDLFKYLQLEFEKHGLKKTGHFVKNGVIMPIFTTHVMFRGAEVYLVLFQGLAGKTDPIYLSFLKEEFWAPPTYIQVKEAGPKAKEEVTAEELILCYELVKEATGLMTNMDINIDAMQRAQADLIGYRNQLQRYQDKLGNHLPEFMR